MSNRNLLMLLVAAVVLSAFTAVLYVGEDKPEGTFQSGARLVQGLPVEKVQTIELKSGEKKVSLRRSGGSFVVASKADYSASTEKVNNLLTSVIDIRCERKVTDSPENHADLGVREGGSDATVVSFYNADGKRLLGLLKGKNAENSPGSYVRRMGEDTVYLSQKPLMLQTSGLDYVDRTLLSLSEDNMELVKVGIKGDTYQLTAGDDGKAALKNVPEGKQAKQSVCGTVFGALTNLRLEDLHRAGDVDVEEWDGDYRCQLGNGVTYRIQTASKDETYYAKLSAGARPADVEITGTESDEELNEKEEAKKEAQEAMQTAKSFKQKHSGWVYEIAEWQAEKLRKPLSELVEDKKPEKISARQILISHADAKESKSDRGKEEARKLAKKLATRLREEDAKFSELAKKNSDGPNAEEGGDLGTVKQGSRNEKFEEAAFALKPGEVSDVVETPYGFHIIKRTE